MTEKLAESFRVKALLNANGSIGMSQKMKINITDTAVFQYFLESILHGAWFNRFEGR